MLLYVPHKLIRDNPFQKRTDYGDIPGLAASIASMYDVYPASRGLQQVPGARLIFKNGTTGPEGEVLTRDKLTEMFKPGVKLPDNLPLFAELEFGHRRGRAFAYLIENDERYRDGLVPLDVRYLTDDQMLDGVWSENYQRRDLSAIEEAQLIAAKLEREKANGGSQRTVAEGWKIDRSTVANKVRLLELPQAVQDANRRGELSERQMAALLPLIDLERKIRTATALGRAKWRWGSMLHDYQAPLSPEKYMIWVQTDEGRKASSEEIRKYVKKIVDSASEFLPESIASFVLAELPLDNTVEQANCKGCFYRLNGDRCLLRTCLDKKIDAYGEALGRQVAEEHGLEFSNLANHFSNLDDADILQAFKKKTCKHLVIGWKPTGYHPTRPFAKSGWASNPLSREGLILGHRGTFCAAIKIKGDGAAATGPGVDEAAVWEKATRKLIGKYQDRFLQALTQHLVAQQLQGEQLSIFVQLVKPKGFEKVMPGDYTELMIRYFYNRSGISYTQSPLKWFQKLRAFLDDVGIGRDVLLQGSRPAEQWKDQATILLHEFADDYRVLDRDWHGDTRALLRGTIEELLRWYEADQTMDIDGSIVEMVEKMRGAAAYIEGIERKGQEKAQKTETSTGDGTLMQVLASEEAHEH